MPTSRRLKVLISAYACEPNKGSEPEVGWQWALQMARFHDVTVLTRANNRPAIEAAISGMSGAKPQFAYFDLGPLLLRLKKRLPLVGAYYILWQRTARDVVAGLLRQQRFDLLHHVTFAAFRYPTVIWGHGVPCIWGPVGGIESIRAALLPWRYPLPLFSEILRNMDNLMRTARTTALWSRARQSSRVLVTTHEMAQAFAGRGIDTQILPTIGLCTTDFPVPLRAVHRDPLRLLFVGNLVALKGLDLALKALKVSSTNARLTLVGDGPFRPALAKLVGALGLGSQVVFRGRLPRDQTLALYKDFDVLLFPSLHDTGGYAVIEAMCNAMPTICLNIGGPAAAVQEGCGISVPPGSRRAVIAGLAEAIQTYDGNRERIVTDGREARRSVEANYDWEHKGRRMNELYLETVR